MKFSEVASFEGNEHWDRLISRQEQLYSRPDDIRTEFSRDYNRILHSTAYRRLKHKTQVFFATRHDHICTRMEHVNHVSSVSYTICRNLGLNPELATAIATGHDLGHAPFGHQGETILKKIVDSVSDEYFWHEKNSLNFVDNIETLAGPDGKEYNLGLTYAVRDGIICHCGEVDDRVIVPRKEYINLENMSKPAEYQPCTWEGCVVKVADKISYLGRDIEDALTIGILSTSQIKELYKIVNDITGLSIREINTTVLIHKFIIDLCENSNPEDGIRFSEQNLELINTVKNFNYKNIYNHHRLEPFKKYAELIINCIYGVLVKEYDGLNTLDKLNKIKAYPLLTKFFIEWLEKYSDASCRKTQKMANRTIYCLDRKKDYQRAIVDYISGMTDSFAIKAFNEITSF